MDRQGHSSRQIAAVVGVSQQQIVHDLKKLRGRYLDTQLAERAAKVGEMLAELRDVKVSAWEEFDRSKAVGMPRIEALQAVLGCIAQERELLGLDSVEQLNVAQANLDWDALLRVVQDDPPERIELQLVEGLDGQGAGGALAVTEVEGENRGGGANTGGSP
jgi:hypothetical protein